MKQNIIYDVDQNNLIKSVFLGNDQHTSLSIDGTFIVRYDKSSISITETYSQKIIFDISIIPINGLVLSNNNKFLATYDKYEINVWDITNHRLISTIENLYVISQIKISNDGKYIATTHSDNKYTAYVCGV